MPNGSPLSEEIAVLRATLRFLFAHMNDSSKRGVQYFLRTRVEPELEDGPVILPGSRAHEVIKELLAELDC